MKRISRHIFSAKKRYSQGLLKKEDILKLSSSPSISPSYPKGPYTFYNREYFIIQYESTEEDIKKIVPEPLIPNKDNIVLYSFNC